MHKRDVFPLVCFGLALFWGAWLLFFWGTQDEQVNRAPQANLGEPVTEPAERTFEPAPTVLKTTAVPVPPEKMAESGGAAHSDAFQVPAVTVQYPEGLEGIKQQIYDINVEYIEDLEKLDGLGRVTDQPPDVLWEGEWSSADDWKRRGDGFRIEQREDGSYAFYPDKDSSRSYEWDEEKGEFSWDLDYYGKIISHKARFIEEDVLVLMKISGRKVALDIYRKNEE